MDSTKVGPGVASGLTNNAPVQKSKGVQKDLDKLVQNREGTDKADFNVNISAKSKEMAEARTKALDIAKNTSDIRGEKVAELKRRIDAGEYKADAGQIADGMMREAIRDELAKNPPEM
ncbi:MAG TPA: flagellar biosynthesis anti-sigma factor FlgM [Oligoflexus sp.]|uniref:flagellar biosynthesis anti-sigma factor FlgM n=1 Tax=Oligoflexus sp. TaxID=1971216 RepID=UPI002D6B4790|nr:flagellar biosynthesis anti-sigma factor FlgM [Oligoflexus sp.]HYX34067.1 flagellar biosynthesis anti-sigma factor FlgM [Oligoflexus sp.]